MPEMTGWAYKIAGFPNGTDIDSISKRLLVKATDSKEKIASRYAQANLTKFNENDCNKAMVAIYNYFGEDIDGAKLSLMNALKTEKEKQGRQDLDLKSHFDKIMNLTGISFKPNDNSFAVSFIDDKYKNDFSPEYIING